jgi:hypothetical protein
LINIEVVRAVAKEEPMASSASSDAQQGQIERLLAAAQHGHGPFCCRHSGDDGGATPGRQCAATRGAEDFWTRWFLTPRVG